MEDKALRMAACEINQILRYTQEEDVRKIPLGLRKFFKEIEDENYVPDLNPEIALERQNVLPETKQILGMIYCFYWSPEELEAIPQQVREDAQQVSQEIFQEYSQRYEKENVPEIHQSVSREQGLTSIPKEPWYKRLFGWFHKK